MAPEVDSEMFCAVSRGMIFSELSRRFAETPRKARATAHRFGRNVAHDLVSFAP